MSGPPSRPPVVPVCFFAVFGRMEHGDPMPPCDGRLVRCHLIPQQILRVHRCAVWDRRAWVWGCGGPVGNGGHHGLFDHSRRLRVPRPALPPAVEELAREIGLEYWLDRTYGYLATTTTTT